MTGERIRVRPPHVLFGIAAVGGVACAGILGIDDRSLDPTLADASTTDGAGPDGTTADSPTADVPSTSDGAHADGTTTVDAATGDAPGADAPAGDAPAGDALAQDAPVGDAPVADVVTRDAPNDAAACPDPCLLASGLNHPFAMASDATNVYWTEFGDSSGSGNGSVKGCLVTGCGAGPTVYAQNLTTPRGIAVDATNVYFGALGGIYKCPLSGCGGGPGQVVTAYAPFGIALDATYIYWVDFGDNTAHRIPKAGGTDTVLYDASDGLVYEPFQLVADGPFLYFMDYNENAFRVSANGGSPAFLGSGNNGGVFGNSFGITTDSTNVYFGGNRVLLRGDKMVTDGGAPIATSIVLPDGLVYDPSTTMVYWSNWGSGNGNDGTVGKIRPDGSNAQVLAAALATPEALTLSGSRLLWVSNGTLNTTTGNTLPNTGALWRTTK